MRGESDGFSSRLASSTCLTWASGSNANTAARGLEAAASREKMPVLAPTSSTAPALP